MSSELFFPLTEAALPLLVLGHHAVQRQERPTFVAHHLHHTRECDHATLRDITFVYCKLERFRPDLLAMQIPINTRIVGTGGVHIPAELLQCPECSKEMCHSDNSPLASMQLITASRLSLKVTYTQRVCRSCRISTAGCW